MLLRAVAFLALIACFAPRARAEAPNEAEGFAPRGFAAQGYSTQVIDSETAARVRTLESDLHVLAAKGGGSITDGVLSIVIGSAFVTLGIVFDEPVTRTLLPTLGGVSIARGIVELAVVPDPSAYALEYDHMPMTSDAQVRDRLIYGEMSLETLAHRNRIARIVDGSLSLAAGAGLVPLYMLVADREYDDFKFGDRIGDYFVAVGAGILVISGTFTLVIKSDAERRFAAYGGFLERLDAEPSARFESRISLALTQHTGAVVWTGKF